MASKILPPLGGANAQRIRAWTPASPRQQGQAGAESVLQRGSPRWGNIEESSGGPRLLSALIRPHTWPPCPPYTHTPICPDTPQHALKVSYKTPLPKLSFLPGLHKPPSCPWHTFDSILTLLHALLGGRCPCPATLSPAQCQPGQS